MMVGGQVNLFDLTLAGLIGISLFQGVHVLRRDPRGSLNRIHAALCLANVIWTMSLLAVTLLDARTDSVALWGWYRFGALGWSLIPALFLHFSLRLVGHGGWRLVVPAYLAGFVFFLCNLSDPVLVSGFAGGPWGTVLVHDPARLSYIVFVVYNSSSIVAAAIHLLRWGRKGRERKQARIIAWSGLVTLVAVYSANLVLPELAPGLPAPGAILTLITLFGIWYAVRRHRLLAMDPGIAAGEIMMRMMDMLFVLDDDARIVDANPQVVQNLGYRVSELRKRPVRDLLVEREEFDRELGIIRVQPTLCARFVAHFHASSGIQVPVVLFLSLVADRYKSIAGGVLVAHDLRGTLQLEEEIAERRRAESSFKTLMHELENERNLLRRRNETMEQELDLARRIQMQIVPRAVPGPGIAFAYLPMSKVGGDYFDFLQTGDPDEVGCFISDVSGHGVPAALITSMIKAFLLQAGSLARDPAALMDALNTVLNGQTGGNFVTAWYGIVNYRSRTLVWTNAGHGDPWLVASGTVSKLEGPWHNLPLAVMSGGGLAGIGREYKSARSVLPGYCRIFLCTDGLLESAPHENPEDLFGGSALDGVLQRTAGLDSSACVDAILAELSEFRGGLDYEDDICVVCLDIPPEGRP